MKITFAKSLPLKNLDAIALGRIVEEGTHETLLQMRGLYAEMYRRQLIREELVDDPGLLQFDDPTASANQRATQANQEETEDGDLFSRR